MQNTDIKFTPSGVILSNETYSELRQFILKHGDTDLPDFPAPISESIVVEKHPRVVKIKDE